MTEEESPPPYSQKCRSCGQRIELTARLTYMCSKCKNYFCEECAMFLHQNVGQTNNNCPGSAENDPHDVFMVKITRNIKETHPIGVSMDKLEKQGQEQSTVRVLRPGEGVHSAKKPSLRILEEGEEVPKPQDLDGKKKRVLVLDDEDEE